MLNPSFNTSQKEAILHHEGACLVLAGPGSGKTTVIINRILHLINEYGVKPSDILSITFTKAAAAELKERYQKVYQGEEMVYFGTFHSVFYHILQSHFKSQENSFITQNEKEKWIRYLCEKSESQLLKEIGMEEVLKNFSMRKNGVTLTHTYDDEIISVQLEELYKHYNHLLQEENKMDYDDILFRCYELLTKKPDICKKWSERFSYILVDEFQDISPMQYQILRLLTKQHNNIFVVGDDDQSIYSFRGANPAITREFLEDYDAKKIVLDVNYRCRKEIVDVSVRVIRHNKNRINKELVAFQTEKYTDSFEIQGFEDVQKQFAYFRDKVQDSGDDIQTRTILCRTNRECKKIAEQLAKMGISYEMNEKKKKLNEHPLVKVIISYIKWLLGDNSRTNFLVMMNCPKRNILRSWLKETVSKNDLLNAAGKDEMKEIEKLFDLRELTKEWRTELIVRYLLSAIGVQKYFEKTGLQDAGEMGHFLLRNVKEYTRLRDWLDYLENTEIGELRNSENDGRTESSLKIMTVHASKGLEFDEVWIFNCNEGTFPSGKHLSEEEVEEERRIFYVAMTRAKKKLHICYLKGTEDNRMECSRFIKGLFQNK